MGDDFDEELRRRNEHEEELRWKRYNSPSRRELSEEYHRIRGDDEIVEGGTPYPREQEREGE